MSSEILRSVEYKPNNNGYTQQTWTNNSSRLRIEFTFTPSLSFTATPSSAKSILQPTQIIHILKVILQKYTILYDTFYILNKM